jgi:hypothetical protein
MTPAVAAELRHVIAHVRTEASAVAVDCAQGACGTQSIRDGTRTVELSPVCIITFYLSPRVLYEHVADLARAISSAPSLAAANTILCNLGVRTEYEFEQEMLRRGVRRYDQA